MPMISVGARELVCRASTGGALGVGAGDGDVDDNDPMVWVVGGALNKIQLDRNRQADGQNPLPSPRLPPDQEPGYTG